MTIFGIDLDRSYFKSERGTKAFSLIEKLNNVDKLNEEEKEWICWNYKLNLCKEQSLSKWSAFDFCLFMPNKI